MLTLPAALYERLKLELLLAIDLIFIIGAAAATRVGEVCIRNRPLSLAYFDSLRERREILAETNFQIQADTYKLILSKKKSCVYA